MDTSVDPEKGRLMFLDEIAAMTRLPENSLRGKYHNGKFWPMWKTGRRLVAWEADVKAWMDECRAATQKGTRPEE